MRTCTVRERSLPAPFFSKNCSKFHAIFVSLVRSATMSLSLAITLIAFCLTVRPVLAQDSHTISLAKVRPAEKFL